MKASISLIALLFTCGALAQDIDTLAGRRVAVLGDSITQGGAYISFMEYYLNRLHPQKKFDIYALGLASETLSGLSEEGHAGGAFPRPCLFERLSRLLEKVNPEVVFACYGINDGIYKPLDPERFTAFKKGVEKLIDQCKAAGVKDIFIVTPPIYDSSVRPGEFNYDSVMKEYAAWEMTLRHPNVYVIDLHTAMRKARDARAEVFSKDKIHPGSDGHLLMAKTILAGAGVKVPEEMVAAIQADPFFKLVDQRRKLRASGWMRHIGYTREKVVSPQELGDTETEAAKLQEKIDAQRRG